MHPLPADETTTTTPPDANRHLRIRRRASVALVVLATISVFVSTLAVWSHAMLLDTDRWVRTVGPLAADERVTRAVAVWGAEEITTAIDVEAFAEQILPERAGFLAAPLGDIVEGFLTDQFEVVLASERFEVAWTEANRFAHRQAVGLLRGEVGVAMADDDAVILNLVPLLIWGLEGLEDRGLLPDSVEVPEVDATTPPAVAVAALSDSLGVDLPSDFGQIVVFRTEDLRQAQEAVALFDRLVVLIVASTVIMGGAALAVSVDRTRTASTLALATTVTVGAALVVIDLTENAVLGRIDDPTYRSAAVAVTTAVLGNLRELQRGVVVVAVIVAALGLLAVRRSPGSSDPGDPSSDREGPTPVVNPVGPVG